MISWYWIPIAFVVGFFFRDLRNLGALLLSWVLYKIFDER